MYRCVGLLFLSGQENNPYSNVDIYFLMASYLILVTNITEGGSPSCSGVAGLLAATDPLFCVRLVLSNWFHLFLVWLLGWGYLGSFSPLLFVRACSSVFVRVVSVLLGFLAVLVFHNRVLFCFIVTPVFGYTILFL